MCVNRWLPVALALAVQLACRSEPGSGREAVGEWGVHVTAPLLLAALAPVAVNPRTRGPCPAGMALVDGMYCPNVEHLCLRYLDPPGAYEHFRCAEYARPAKCRSKVRRHLRFCMDKQEYTSPGERLPANFQNFTAATRICKSLGKRVCREREWNFACEGEEMRPYPYGWRRDPYACNADRTDLFDREGKLLDLRVQGGTFPACASPFGIHDLSGNLEEFVRRDAAFATDPAMKGAYWQPSRNHCRAAQTAHDRYYRGIETGFRCCSEPLRSIWAR